MRSVMIARVPRIAVFALALTPSLPAAQTPHGYQTDFTRDELTARRARIYDAIGAQGIALVQGSSGVPGISVVRQSNDFYYLSGVESAPAYLLMNGRSRRTTLYLPHRDEEREQGEGKVLSVEDRDAAAKQVVVEFTQTQAGEPFQLSVEIGVTDAAGKVRVERAEVSGRSTRVTFSAEQAPTELTLDPQVRTLMDSRLVRRP